VRYLGLALFAEGSTDHRFLSPILRRVTEELCLRHSQEVVEIGGILELHSPPKFRERDRATRIAEAASEARGAFNILFIHTDGAGDPERARRERIDPAAQRIIEAGAGRWECPVAVVPVRETEAWTLVDGDALRAAFGTVLNDEGLGIPSRCREVESISDPKQALEQVFTHVIGSGRRRKRKAAAFMDAIGERVQLTLLRQVPAFQRFERELGAALTRLGYLNVETS
jgi:hypothetical protein